MVSGPSEIAVGLWVGTQVTCPLSQAAPQDLGRYLESASLGLGCPLSTRRQDGIHSLLSSPYPTPWGWYFLASCSWFHFFPDSCLDCPLGAGSSHLPIPNAPAQLGWMLLGVPRQQGEVASAWRGGMDRLFLANHRLLCISCLSPLLAPALFLQLIPHFLSKIPRELLVCVFPRHVLICHPLPLAGSHSAGFPRSPSLRSTAVSRPGWWLWCDHQERQVPPAPCQEILPPSHLPRPIESLPSGSQICFFFF